MINPVSPLPVSTVLPAQGGVVGAPELDNPLFMQLLEALIGASGKLGSELLKASQAVVGSGVHGALTGAIAPDGIFRESSTHDGDSAGEPGIAVEHELSFPAGALEAVLALLSAAGRLQPSQIITPETAPAVWPDEGIVMEMVARPDTAQTTPGVATLTTVPFAEAPNLLAAGTSEVPIQVPAVSAPPLPPPSAPVSPAEGSQKALNELQVYEAPPGGMVAADANGTLPGRPRPAVALASDAALAAGESVSPALVAEQKPLQEPAAGEDIVRMPVYAAASALEPGMARPSVKPAPAAGGTVEAARPANQPAETAAPAGREGVTAARSPERGQESPGVPYEGVAGQHAGSDSPNRNIRPVDVVTLRSDAIDYARQDDASRLLRASVVDQIARSAHLFSERGRSGLSIQLEPADLGKVQVHVGFGSDGLQVKLATEIRDTMNVIQAALPQLKDALESQGLRIESFGLALGAGLPGFDTARDSGQPRQWLEAQPASLYYPEMDPAGEDRSRREVISPESLIDYRV